MKTSFWNKYYRKPLDEIPWQNVQADWFKTLVDNKKITGASALDLGCGTGQKIIYLAKNGFNKVIGVDISKHAIEIANQNREKQLAQCQFVCADATKWKFINKDEIFDLILDWANIHGIPAEDKQSYVKGISQHSHKETLLLIRSFSSQNKAIEYIDLNSNQEFMRMHMLYKKDLNNLFPDFRIIKSRQSKPNPTQQTFTKRSILSRSFNEKVVIIYPNHKKTIQANKVIVEFDEDYQAGKIINVKSHFHHEFTNKNNRVNHHLTISDVNVKYPKHGE